MVRKTVEVFVDRPLEAVFEYGTAIDRLPDWNGPLKSARLTSDPPLGVGSTYVVEAQMGPGFTQTVEAEVTEYDPPNRACYETRSGLSYRSCREFEAVDGGTRVTETLDAEPGPVARLVVGPMVRLFARTQRKNLRELKRQLEDEATADERSLTGPSA